MKNVTKPKTKLLPPLVNSMSKKYEQNERQCGTDDLPCIICGKPVKNAFNRPETKWLRAGGGSLETIIDPNSPEDGGEMGCWPIGPDCLRKNPQFKPYLTPNGTEDA